MLRHIVMWKLIDENKEENCKKIKMLLEELKKVIPEIKTIEVGIDTNTKEGNFDVVLNSEFEDEKALEVYSKHPEHLKVAEFIGRVRTNRTAVDYKF